MKEGAPQDVPAGPIPRASWIGTKGTWSVNLIKKTKQPEERRALLFRSDFFTKHSFFLNKNG